MNYLEVKFSYDPQKVDGEILLAEISDLPFESFVEEESELTAYVLKEDFKEAALKRLPFLIENSVEYSVREIEDINWNEEWEKNFDPVIVEDRCAIKATFHNLSEGYEYTILVDPKMSFGTGHHPTTYLIVKALLDVDLTNKKVLDMGAGTGILAIMAHLKGARNLIAIDNNPWAFENAGENISLNHMDGDIEVRIGGAEAIGNDKFDVILANINRNVIVSDLPDYVEAMNDGGQIYISGVMSLDAGEVHKKAESLGLKLVKEDHRDQWSMLIFSKNS
jgi:ribosomal protein L11 methyltransferase